MAEKLLYNGLSFAHFSTSSEAHMAKAVALPPGVHLSVDDDNDDDEDEGFIDMDLSFTNATSSPSAKEFEFKMCQKGAEKELFGSPADELFYKGKLLPLLLSPRLRLVENLLDSSSRLESPVPTTPTSFSHKKKSFAEKFKLKLKASQSYLKALFTRDPHKAVEVEEELARRRSFSGAAIARNSTAKSPSSCSSSSCSSSFSCSSSQIVLKRSSSASSEIENSILGAIAYCKESQEQANARMRSMAIACQPQERPRPCDNSTK